MDEEELLKERFKSAVSSTVKAVSGNYDLEIKFGDNSSTKKNSLTIKKNPNKPPIVIIETKVAGTVQIAFPPIWADTIPTLTIARKWSKPKTGWEIPS